MSTWILLRGLTRESGHWGAFPDLLRERLGHGVVVPLDLPGNGELHADDSPTTIEAMARCCQARVESAGLAPPYRLLAMSMGAMVAIDWARHDPRGVAGCVLINTSMRPFDPWYRRLRPSTYGTLLRLAWPGGSDLAREQAILRLTSGDPSRVADVLPAWTAMRRGRPVTARNALRQLLAASRFRAPAAAPGPPLLVLASRHDGLVDARCSIGLARRWQASLAVHEKAGHDLPLDDAPWVVDQVAQWLARRAAAEVSPVER